MAAVYVRTGFALLALGWGAACYAQAAPATPPPGAQPPQASAGSPVDEAAQEQLLHQAVTQIKAGMNADAINGPLAQIIHTYETAYAHSKPKIYCAQTLTEALVYSGMKSSNRNGSVVLSKPTWAMAYYLRGYAYGSMGDMAHSEESLKQALVLSPFNSQFLSELGNVYENEKNWSSGLDAFQNAYAAAEFAPPAQQVSLRCHALRGQGFVLVELHKLDEATQKYNACLSISPGDQRSLDELGYVKGLQAKAAQ
jgi:tetratricopeptide (TPR) repeat protein